VIAAPQRANISHIPDCNMVALALGQRERPARLLRPPRKSRWVARQQGAFGSFRSTAPGEGSMAVSLRDRGAPPKDNVETRARYAWHDIEADWRVAPPRPKGSRRQSYATDSDRNFERVARFFYVGAGVLVVIGTAIVVGSAFWGELPQNIDPADSTTPQRIAAAPASRGAGSDATRSNMQPHEQPASIVAGPVEPTSPQERASASTQNGAEPAPAAEGSGSIASSIANLDLQPEFLNDDIAGRRRKARRDIEDGASATQKPVTEEAAPDARTGKCYVRIAGRVLNSGACQISRESGGVTFQYAGQTLTLSPVKGKTWSATLGGKNIGSVYKRGSCWGSRSTYICDRSG
jgi:hypothetical protein